MLLARRILMCAALLFISTASFAQAIPNIGPHRGTGGIIPGQYIVTLVEGADPDAVARERGVRPDRRFNRALRGFVARLDPAARAELERDPRVRRVEPDREMVMSATAWGLDRIDQRALPLNDAYSANGTGSGVTAYVFDSGIRLDHAIFAGRAVRGIDVINDGQNGNDCNGHGTHVAGTIGGATYGVAPGTTLVSVRVLDCAGSGPSSGIIAALDWVIANARRPAVVNMSLGGGISLSLEDAVRRVVAAGIPVIVAAGNEGADACQSSPARIAEVVTIAATDRTDRKPDWSNWGNCVDLFAPGDSILSAYHSGATTLAYMSGTSMAAPHAAGVAALLLARDPALTPAGLRSALLANATANVVTGGQSATSALLYSGSAASAPAPAPAPPPSSPTLQGTAGDDVLNGGSGDDQLDGLAGNDMLNGMAGADTMRGGAGNDIYVADNVGDVVTELAGEGTDEVRTSLGSRSAATVVRYVLPAHVETLTGTLGAGQSLEDNGLNNVITTGAGSDLVVASHGGNDTISTGGGADFIFFGPAFSPADTVDAGGGNGRDKVGLHGDYALAIGAGSLTGVEELVLYASDGGDFDYSITTHDGNVASGIQLEVTALSLAAGETLVFDGSAEGDGSFWIRSGAGADTVTAGAGADRILGGLGADRLTGGGGADRFDMTDAAHSTGTGYDTLVGFDARVDRINVTPAFGGWAASQSGAVSRASFDADLAGLVNAVLGNHQAVKVTVAGGDLDGRIFVVFDANGDGSYTAGQDLVWLFEAPVQSNLEAFNFII